MTETNEIALPQPSPSPRTVLVLGGGGMKGIAHIGVWKALEEAGVRPDAIMGTSIGALIGAGIASGFGWRELAEVARKLTKDDIVAINRRAVFFGGVREDAVFMGDHFRRYIEGLLPVKSFAEMKLPFRLNTVSLVSGEEVWFGTDCRQDLPVASAVYASCALPIYFPPCRTPDGDFLVDGGVLDVFPVRKAQAWGAERIIGVDVGSEFLPPAEGFFDRGMIAIHDRVLNLNLRDQRSRCLDGYDGPPLMYVRPKVWHLGGWDFDRTQYFLEEGYRATRQALKEQEAA